jgi:elongation factor Tu
LEEKEESSLGTGSVRKLMETVDEYIPQPERSVKAPFLLSIENSYVITGRGTVVTGKIEQGVINIGDPLEIIGNNKKKEILTTSCVGLEMFRKILTKAEVGDNVGVLLKAVKKDEVKRGFVLAAPSSIKPYKKFIGKVYVLSAAEGGRKKAFVSNFKPQFFFRTANVTGTVILEDVSVVMPGDSLNITVELIEYCPLHKGLRFIFRESHCTIGAGVITETIDI